MKPKLNQLKEVAHKNKISENVPIEKDYYQNSSSRANNNEIVYTKPDKPLTFTFKNANVMEDFLEKEATSGTKRKIEKKTSGDGDKTESKLNEKNQFNLYIDDDQNEKAEIKKKKEANKDGEIIEGSLRGEKMIEPKGKKIFPKEDEKKEVQKNKIVYKTYTNSVIFANNELRSLDKIHTVLYDIIPDLTFSSPRTKLDFIQWIDVSRNHLTEISEDITRLPFLKILYVHGNYIQEIERVTALSKCPSLTSLTLYGNPIEHIKGYRQFIIEMIPLLDKLDYALVSEKELDIIHFKGSRYGEVRKNGKVLKYPKLSEEMLKTFKIPDGNDKEKKEEI